MRAGRKTAQKVLRNLYQNVLPPPEIAAVYAVRVHEDWARLRLMSHQLEQLDLEAATLVDDTVAGVLVSVPGMTPAYATRYLAHIQDVEQFATADKIWAFAGFDPVLNASGDRHQLGKISRKGDPAFRDTLYQLGQSTARHCPPIRDAFKRKYNPREKNHVLATIHAAHKTNRMLYHLLKTQQTYRDVYGEQ
jgi:transposase